MLALFVLCAVLCSTAVQSQMVDTRDMLTDTVMDHIWMEIGYSSLNFNNWTDVVTTVVNFNADNDKVMSAFFALPSYGDGIIKGSFPVVPKMDGKPTRNPDGSYSFRGMLVMPDDDECAKGNATHVWWVPSDPGAMLMPWLIAEQGVYNLSSNMIIVQEGNITRENAKAVFDDLDEPKLANHTVFFNFTRGCNQIDKDEICRYDDHPDDHSLDSETSYEPWLKMGALQQLQTSNRKTSDGRELFLSVRGRTIFTHRAQFMVATHSVDRNISAYGTTYETIDTPELLAFMIYEKGLRIQCTEGLVIETEIFFGVTSDAIPFNYVSVFSTPPGLFGMLGSMRSVADATILRSFNREKTSVQFITQEDQCVDDELRHTSKETAFAFVVGELDADASVDVAAIVMNCWALFENNDPTGAPTGQPSTQPSSTPSSVPSSLPTSTPTSAPTTSPTSAPSSTPTTSPTSAPSSTPTTSPTSRPTLSPTFSPTAVPTVSPTSAPSEPAGNCTFNFLLFDLFGDGFYTTYVNVTTTNHREENSSSHFYQPNCTAAVVSVYSETCSMGVSMLTKDGANPLLTWESYWILNHEGETYIGDFFSQLSIQYGLVIESSLLVDYSVPGKDNNKCHECPHPPKFNANSPPGVCESSATAKECPPGHPNGAIGPGAPGKGGPGAGGKGGPAPGSRRTLRGDDDHSGHNHTTDDAIDKDDDHSGHNHTTDDAIDKDDDHSGRNYTTDDAIDKDDEHSGNNTDDFFDNYNSTDDGSGSGTDDHIHYSYGKPKPKPKPPYLVYINMYDELSNGYLDKSGDWSDYFNTQELIGTGGEYAELKAPILIPNVLAYPKYYLMTKDRQKLIKSPKSVCAQNRGTEFCQEALPWNGHFIFRFAGIEPKEPADAATWEFCGLSGGINEEFEFIMREGVCVPLTNKLTAAAYCEYGFETAINMNGAFNIAGNFNSLSSLSELDTSLLEKELALLMPGQLAVTIESVTHEADDSFNVYFKASVIAESAGYDGSQVDKVETLMYELEATLGAAFTNGLTKSNVLHDLDALPNTEDDLLRQVTSLKLLGNMEIDSMTYQERKAGVNSHTGETGGSWSVPENIHVVSSPGQEEPLSETTGVISLAAVLVGALVAVLVATSVVKQRNGGEAVDLSFGLPSFGAGLEEHTALPGNSEHADERDTQLEEESAHPLSSLQASTRPMIDLSLSSVEEGHKAIHYADDIDAALFNHSKQQYELNVANKRSFI